MLQRKYFTGHCGNLTLSGNQQCQNGDIKVIKKESLCSDKTEKKCDDYDDCYWDVDGNDPKCMDEYFCSKNKAGCDSTKEWSKWNPIYEYEHITS